MKLRPKLRRWHTWLGWVVGVPILFWAVSGLVMVWKPIEEVRGEHLLREPPPVQLTAPPVPPQVEGLPLTSLSLEPRAAGTRWVATLRDGTTRLADPATGAWLQPYSAADAVREVAGRYAGDAKLRSVSRTDAGNPPLDLRRPIASWRVAMDDGTRFYVDSASGRIVATRTGWWRFYDWMWGLHIMDLKTREDMHNPLLLGFATAAVLASFLALVLLPTTIRRRRRRAASE